MRNGKGFNKWQIGDLECPIARVLQSIEAHLILDLVCGNLLRSMPHMPLYTIHDCIVTTNEFEQTVQEAISNVYGDIFGFAPNTKVINNWALD